MTARTATLVRIAAVDVLEARPDGPLARDLAAWVADPRLGGLEVGPLAVIWPHRPDELNLDAEVDVDALAAWVGRTVLLIDPPTPTGRPTVILGQHTPTVEAALPVATYATAEAFEQLLAVLAAGWQIIADITLATDEPTIDVDVTGYTGVRFTLAAQSTHTGAGTDSVRARLNGDTGNNYATGVAALTSHMVFGSIGTRVTNTNRLALMTGQWHYTPGLFLPVATSTNPVSSTGTGAATTTDAGCVWQGAASAAPTDLELHLATGPDFAAGARLIVEGIA